MAEVDAPRCAARLKALLDAWEGGEAGLFGDAATIVVGTGKGGDDAPPYLKSVALQLWLFGYEITDTVLLLVKATRALHVVTSGKTKTTLISGVKEECKATAGADIVMHERPKGTDGVPQVEELVAVAREAGGAVGHLPKEQLGSLLAVWKEKAAGLALVDVAAAIGDVLAPKDAAEQQNLKKAAHLTNAVLDKQLQAKILSTIENEKPVSHAKLSRLADKAIEDPSTVGVKLNADNIESCFPPIVQSGSGKPFACKWSVASSNDNLHIENSVIVVALGARYQSYCSAIARSYLIDPTKGMEAAYAAVIAAHKAAVGALVPGAPLTAAYEAAQAALKAAPEGGDALAEALGKDVGSVLGLEFQDRTHLLSPKGTGSVREGMVFNVSVALQGLKTEKSGRPYEYGLWIADTVLVGAEGAAAEVLTTSSKEWAQVAFFFEEDAPAAKPAKQKDAADKPTVLLDSHTRMEAAGPGAEELRKRQQEELVRKKTEETYKRLTGQAGQASASAAAGGVTTNAIMSYKSVKEMPTNRSGDLRIVVDKGAETVLLPVYGILVPFHIHTIKNISVSSEGDQAYIRINFQGPGGGFGGAAQKNLYPPAREFPDCTFLKDISFRSADTRHANAVMQEVKQLRKAVTQRETERAERATLVRQEKLQLGRGRIHKLQDVWIRPGFGGRGKKLSGVLEAHANGFRYATPKKEEQVDIIYRNIKHAFFQPAKNELITVIHFHLHSPIMVGKKKTSDVQVYTEVMDAVQSLDAGRSSMYDPDEIEEEQRERERRNKINAEFQHYVKRVQDLWERDFADLDLEFDIPFRELGFPGVPHRESSTVIPTVNCLVDIVQVPFMVLTLSEIEIVALERAACSGIKNFDLCVVFKDFNRDTHTVNSVPMQSLETIKEWLTSINVSYFETKVNLIWKNILPTIRDNPEKFVEEGGWAALNLDEGDDEEDEDEASEEYAPTEEDESDDEESSEDESLVDDEDDDDEEGSEEEEEEEEGLDWDELEAEARAADKARDERSDDEDDERRKRKGGGGGGPSKKQRR